MISAATMTLLLTMAQVGPSLEAIERLSPRAAGDLALRRVQHRPIVEIVTPPIRGLEVPGTAYREMVEQAVRRPDGCLRRRWKVSFSQGRGLPSKGATMASAFASTEVALPRRSSCEKAEFVAIGQELNPTEAYSALYHLNRFRSPKVAVKFSCSDDLRTGLCNSDRTIRTELMRLRPWTVIRRDGAMLIWFNERGTATEVRYRSDNPSMVRVTRSIPPPA